MWVKVQNTYNKYILKTCCGSKISEIPWILRGFLVHPKFLQDLVLQKTAAYLIKGMDDPSVLSVIWVSSQMCIYSSKYRKKGTVLDNLSKLWTTLLSRLQYEYQVQCVYGSSLDPTEYKTTLAELPATKEVGINICLISAFLPFLSQLSQQPDVRSFHGALERRTNAKKCCKSFT